MKHKNISLNNFYYLKYNIFTYLFKINKIFLNNNLSKMLSLVLLVLQIKIKKKKKKKRRKKKLLLLKKKIRKFPRVKKKKKKPIKIIIRIIVIKM